MSDAIAWLGQPEAHEASVVGGKAASLSRLAAGYDVPPGFALPAPTLRDAHVELVTGVVPEALANEIVAAYELLGGARVAVRSSALDEDGAVHSFAGLHETLLNVEGTDAVLGAVSRCYESGFTPRALAYRRDVGLPVDGIGLAVLVQAQILSDVSAVVFSVNPINGHTDEIVVNASYGLGESIVGGTTTPDTYILRKSDLEILSCTVGEKRLMTVPIPGGTREVETPALLRSERSLTDAQAVEMGMLARRLETEGGAPVDVECALAAGSLYLLQSRPITTLRDTSEAERRAQ